MYKLSVSIPDGRMVIQFAVQKRRANGKRVYRDTICFGTIQLDKPVHEAEGPTKFVVLTPGVTYQSAVDTYDVFEGVRYALTKFFQVNGIRKDIRKKVWESLLHREDERKSFEDYKRVMRQRNNLGPLTAAVKDRVAAVVRACEEGPPYGDMHPVLQELVSKVEGQSDTIRQGPATEPDEKSI